MKHLLLISTALFALNIFSTSRAQEKTPYDYVDPFIGTDNMGHTFPGASMPFGLVQLSPDTDTVQYSYGSGYNPEVYRYCAGYQYGDNTIVGFSHTHFNGTGHSDLGDFLIMPTTGKLQINPGTRDDPDNGYRSRFSHSTEKASPGYYAVTLDDYNIKAELTTSIRTGFHKYTFPKSDDAHIILDLTSGIYNYDGKTIWSAVRFENDTLITGYKQTNGWARGRFIYFAMVLSKPVKSYGLINEEQFLYKGFWRKFDESSGFPERAGHKLKCFFNFETEEGEEILIKFAISGVSTEGALKNLQTEIPHWDFNAVKASARAAWEKELSKITVETTDEKKTNFYTSMYHAFLSPVIFNDVDGRYRGLDGNIYTADYQNHTIFSLWDTYRALHPLYTLVQQRRTNDIVKSMLDHYRQSVHKVLPVWSHWGAENWCMIGYHAVSVIADAYLKGIDDYDVNTAFEAVVSSADYDIYDGIGGYRKYGYVPEDVSNNSASKTLEYAYDDWTIYKFAMKLGRTETAERFKQRAFSYKNIFDNSTGYMRAKYSNGEFKEEFDPLSVAGQGYIEGNAWNYSLYVPHDIKGFIELIGGNDKMITWLDSLFAFELPEKYLHESEDVSKVGMIGNYVHGNEPSHHVPYMYSFAGAPEKTAGRIHQIMNTMYKPKPDGLCGNDDCGQMSAWYIFSALGFYPVAPGSGQYVVGSPCVNSAVIRFENNNVLEIKAEGLSAESIYIKEIRLNGNKLNRYYLTHEELTAGGELVFIMSAEASPYDDSVTEPYSLKNEKLKIKN